MEVASIELGVSGIGYDEVLPDGDVGGGGGDEQDDDDEDEDDDDDEDEDVSSVNGVVGEGPRAAGDVAVVGPVGWIELSLWPRWVMRFAPRVTSRPGVAARHRDTSEAHRV